MLLLLRRGLPSRSYSVLALIATNLVISMPAPPSKRSPEDTNDASSGFSNVPKILEIQLPLKIATKDDLVAWAKYVMGLMASKINITLTTVKESPSKSTGDARPRESVRIFDNARQPQNSRSSAYKGFENVSPVNGIRQFANANSFQNTRYAEHVRNFGQIENFDRSKVPATIRILENARHSENIRNPLNSGNVESSKEKIFANPRLPAIAIAGVTTNNVFNDRQLQSTFGNGGTTLPSPLGITANINVPRARIKEPIATGNFDATNSLRTIDQQLFVPELPNFRPFFDPKDSNAFQNTTAITPPPRTYLPVTTATDNIEFPTNPFLTRYFFDGVQRNISSNVAAFPSDITLTTENPLMFGNGIPLPVRDVDLLSLERNLSSVKPLFNVPFEAVITFTGEGEPIETTTRGKYFTIPTRESVDQFPSYFDTNFTLPNESGRINVVLDDGTRFVESRNETRKDERKKQDKKKDKSKDEKSKKQKSGKQTSAIGQLLKNFVAMRRNKTLSENLSPPPVNQQVQTSTQRPPPERTQQSYPPKKPPSARQGRRNQTSLAQQLEDGDDNGSKESGSKEEDARSKEEDSDESNGKKNDNGSDDARSNKDESSNESEYDDSDEEEGGFVKTLIDLLQLGGPIIEDLSDPESDTDIADVLDAAIPLIQDLSEGDGEGEGLDLPGLLLPLLMKISGDENMPRDSSAILTPLLRLIAPLIGPLVGPLIIPLSRQSSQPMGEGGSSAGDLIKSLLDPLLQPIGPGKMTPLSNLVAGVVSSLSKNSGPGGVSDLASLVKAVVAGTIAGTSAGSSGRKDYYGPSTGYGVPPAYGANCQRGGFGGRC